MCLRPKHRGQGKRWQIPEAQWLASLNWWATGPVKTRKWEGQKDRRTEGWLRPPAVPSWGPGPSVLATFLMLQLNTLTKSNLQAERSCLVYKLQLIFKGKSRQEPEKAALTTSTVKKNYSVHVACMPASTNAHKMSFTLTWLGVIEWCCLQWTRFSCIN